LNEWRTLAVNDDALWEHELAHKNEVRLLARLQRI
jgi:hypothetical protein